MSTPSLRVNGVKFPDGSNAPSGVINVKDPVYGAIGDDSNDDTAAIQAAVTAAAANRNMTVFFPIGTYKVTGTITIHQGVKLVGSGSQGSTETFGTVIKHYSNSNLFVWDGNGTSSAGTGGGMLHFLIAKATTFSGGDAIYLLATDSSHRPGEMQFEDILILGLGTGLWARGLHIDGTACDVAGARGVRDLTFHKFRVGGCDGTTYPNEAVRLSQPTHFYAHHFQIDTGNGVGSIGMTIDGNFDQIYMPSAEINGNMVINAPPTTNYNPNVFINGVVNGTFTNNATTIYGHFIGYIGSAITNSSASGFSILSTLSWTVNANGAIKLNANAASTFSIATAPVDTAGRSLQLNASKGGSYSAVAAGTGGLFSGAGGNGGNGDATHTGADGMTGQVSGGDGGANAGGGGGKGGDGLTIGGTGAAGSGSSPGAQGGKGKNIGGSGGAGTASAAAGRGGDSQNAGGAAGANNGGGGANGGDFTAEGGAPSGAGTAGLVKIGTTANTSAITIGGGSGPGAVVTSQAGSATTATGLTSVCLYRDTTVTNSVTSGETDGSTYTMPANVLASNGQAIKISAAFTHAANANSTTYKTYFAGTAIESTTAATSGDSITVEIIVVRTTSTTATYRCAMISGAGLQQQHGTLSALNFAASNIIKISVTGATTNGDLSTNYLRIEWWP